MEILCSISVQKSAPSLSCKGCKNQSAQNIFEILALSYALGS